MKTNELKDTFFEESAKIFKVLSSPIRLKLINYISFCPRTVEDCAEKFGQSMQNISLHLQSLGKIGILEVEKLKNYRIYSLSDKRVLEVLTSDLIARPRSILPLELNWQGSLEDLAKAVIKEKIKLIDVRDPQETAFIPVEGAIELDPEYENLKSFYSKFRPDQEVVIFCRGRWCERMAETIEKSLKHHPNVKGAGLTASQLQLLNQLLTE